jgi:hypothetical protein
MTGRSRGERGCGSKSRSDFPPGFRGGLSALGPFEKRSPALPKAGPDECGSVDALTSKITDHPAARAARALCTAVVLCFYAEGESRGGRMKDVIGKLTAGQALKIVERLYRKGGEIREAVVAEAMNLLAEFSVDETAGEVFDGLDLIDVQDCWDRSGGSREGYTSPDEAAVDLIEEELQRFFDQVERYHELDMPEQEAAYCMAVILGIYRFEHESKSEFKNWAEHIAAECAGNLLHEWRERKPGPAAIDAMQAFIRERCPKWADWLKDE